MEEIVSISELRQNAARLLRETANGKVCLVVSRSRPVAVIVSPDKYRHMQNRIRVLEESDLLRAIERGEDEHRRGKTRRLRSLRDLGK